MKCNYNIKCLNNIKQIICYIVNWTRRISEKIRPDYIIILFVRVRECASTNFCSFVRVNAHRRIFVRTCAWTRINEFLFVHARWCAPTNFCSFVRVNEHRRILALVIVFSSTLFRVLFGTQAVTSFKNRRNERIITIN